MTDMMQLQQDELSLPARSLVPLLGRLRSEDSRVRRALGLLAGWDHVLDRNSVAAAIYFAWERRLLENVYELMVPPEGREVFRGRSLRRMISWVSAPDGAFGQDPLAGRDAVLLRSLEEALGELTERLGPDMERWQYGQERLKHVQIRHALTHLVAPGMRDSLTVGPHPRGGYGQTVNSTSNSYNQASGATFRIIADTGDWDASVGTNSPGQSGDPRSPYFDNLFRLWAEGGYFPVLYSRARVESVAREVTVLAPGR